ncbi:MAG: ParB/RepB/Spo0J family partition protein [Proteobacteria bacterium]|jgi:ParB family chromosome partitioning protein|nr:ParB/RepB/Spo0J family partition protein [Alphaproteobacteria bacterium]NCC03612.1 ParB/RepB/Spo0J family partition protein [Pseudomonadota bacterium]
MNAKAQAKPAPLGRGLSALFGDADVSYQPKNTGAAPSSVSVAGPVQTVPQKLPIEWIQPGAFQPRRHFDDTAIRELADSIKERGILQPLMVRPLGGEKDSYEIIAGERRWRAAQLVGLHEVPVLIRSFTDREAMEIGLIENVQRQDLSLIEEAEGYRRLIEEFQHTQDNLAKIVGKSRPHIANLLRLLKLPAPVRHMLNEGTLSMGHARAIVTADDPETVAKEIIKKGLNVRQAEALAKKLSDGRFAKKERTRKDIDPNILAIENNLQNTLGVKVRLQSNGTTGALVLHYSDLDQLDLVLKKLQA